ncbi:MAG: diguanylate cyclase [Nitrospirales bacterium]|nr:diguanylate cyclase [Nitrospirales bacterium]
MKICFPVLNDNGLESKVHNHFGNAPFFIVVDAETKAFFSIENRDLDHAHGACSPLNALSGQAVDAIVLAGIGRGALRRLNSAGIRVYRTQGLTIAESLEKFSAGKLREFSFLYTCGGKNGSCSH